MFVSLKVISAVFILAPAVSGLKVSTLRSRLRQVGSLALHSRLTHFCRSSSVPLILQLPSRKLTTQGECFVAGSESCGPPNSPYICDTINGHAYWTVTDIASERGQCKTKCVAESDLEFILDEGYECGPCKVCATDFRCKLDSSDVKYTYFRVKNDGSGKCEEKCEREGKHGEMHNQGYNCGFCPATYDTKDGTKDSIVLDPKGVPPVPDKCTLKRALHVMRYEPNWPALEEDVIVQVRADEPWGSGTIYNFTVSTILEGEHYPIPTKNEAEFPIPDEIYPYLYDKTKGKDEQGVSVRFVSPRGPGEWNSCNYSPIAIDLNNDGEVTRIEPQDVGRTEGWTIDITGDGDEEYLNEWFGPEEGILVDLSGQYGQFMEEAGKQGRRVQDLIITGVQLLGDQGHKYADGFEKLKVHDADGNGIVEAKELVGFHIWIDSNSNAKLDNNELSNLADHDIVGLRVTQNNFKSTAILANGTEILTEDLWLNRRRRRALSA